MSTPRSISAEYQRAISAEGALGDRITKEVNARAVAATSLADRITALENATTVTPPPVVVPPPVTPPSGTLQQIIDGTQAGGSVDLTGWTGKGGATISKPITIKGLTTSATSGNVLNITNCKGVTLDHPVLSGGNTAFAGLWATNVQDLTLLNPTVTDCTYAGFMLLSVVGFHISGLTAQRIGVGGANGANAYGIAFSDEGGVPTSDGVLSGFTIEDVPTWQGVNSHNGQRIEVASGTVRRCRRAYWFAPVGSKRIVAINVHDCRAETVPLPVYDPTAYFIMNSDGCSFTNNSMSSDYPHPADGGEWKSYIRDYGSGSTGLVRTGTTVR